MVDEAGIVGLLRAAAQLMAFLAINLVLHGTY